MTTDLLTRPEARPWTPTDPDIIDDATRREFLTGLAATGLLVACGRGTDDGANDGVAPSGATRTVEHFFGSTEVPVEPQRIVVAATPALGNLLELGATIAATVEPNVAGSQDYLGARAENVPKLGSEFPDLNLEAIAAVEPDLIVTIGADFAREKYDLVRAIAPTVAPAYGYATIAEVSRFLVECGVSVGREERARQLADDLGSRIEQLADRIAADYGDQTVTLLRVQTDGFAVLLGDTAAGLLDALGVRRPDGQEFDAEAFSLDLSLERIGELAGADTMFVYTDAAAEDTLSALTNSPLWARLPAVEQDRVFFVPGSVWAIGVDVVAINLMLDEIELRLTT